MMVTKASAVVLRYFVHLGEVLFAQKKAESFHFPQPSLLLFCQPAFYVANSSPKHLSFLKASFTPSINH